MLNFYFTASLISRDIVAGGFFNAHSVLLLAYRRGGYLIHARLIRAFSRQLRQVIVSIQDVVYVCDRASHKGQGAQCDADLPLHLYIHWLLFLARVCPVSV